MYPQWSIPCRNPIYNFIFTTQIAHMLNGERISLGQHAVKADSRLYIMIHGDNPTHIYESTGLGSHGISVLDNLPIRFYCASSRPHAMCISQ